MSGCSGGKSGVAKLDSLCALAIFPVRLIAVDPLSLSSVIIEAKSLK
jgi:hypothetical protein